MHPYRSLDWLGAGLPRAEVSIFKVHEIVISPQTNEKEGENHDFI
ncbi:UNVERIFIED_CONTAM: hypothetical protein N8J90_04490 [Halobacillus marinus]